jgi:hypothetical protein
MNAIHAVGVGFFALILTYLAVTHADGVSGILKSGGGTAVDLTKALQGR